MKKPDPIVYYNPGEIADRLNVTRRTVYTWIVSGRLGALKIGPKLWQISQKQLDDFLNPTLETASVSIPETKREPKPEAKQEPKQEPKPKPEAKQERLPSSLPSPVAPVSQSVRSAFAPTQTVKKPARRR